MLSMRWRSGTMGWDGLWLEEFGIDQPGPGELLVQISHAALNFSDLLMLEDRYQVRPTRPFTPGQELAGHVIAGGPGTSLAPRTRIAAKVVTGGFATHALVPESQAILVPDAVPLSKAAALPVVYITAYVGLTEVTQIKQGEVLLVTAAAGGTGLAAVQVGKAQGATVIGMASTPEKRAIATAQGADHVLSPDDDWPERLAELAPDGLDVVFDTLGGDTTLQALDLLRTDGRLLIVGFAGAPPAKLPAQRVMTKRARVLGVSWNHETDGEMLGRATARMMADLAARRIDPLVERREGLESLPRALADLAARQTTGKVVLELDD